MIYKRHYVQFNDLVFDGYDMIEETDTTVSFKSFEQEYTFKHGNYMPNKASSVLAEAGTVSMTLYFKMKKLPCDVRKFYPQFVTTQLTAPGKLWAVQNNTLIWAYAQLSEYVQVQDAKRDTIKVDVDFTLPEGIWHKADKQRTFLAPHDLCEFMDCYGYKDINPCDCCNCADPVDDCNCCYCHDLSKEMALCYFKDLQFFYDRCDSDYHIVYDCEAGEKFFFPDFVSGTYIGQRFCADCVPIYGLLYSDTEIPTSGVKITLHGKFSDPKIQINDNANIIKGEYDGALVIYPDGSVYYRDKCCETLIDVSKWVIPDGMEYGWTVHAGNNSVRIYPHNEECGLVCAYIEVDALTM